MRSILVVSLGLSLPSLARAAEAPEQESAPLPASESAAAPIPSPSAEEESSAEGGSVAESEAEIGPSSPADTTGQVDSTTTRLAAESPKPRTLKAPPHPPIKAAPAPPPPDPNTLPFTYHLKHLDAQLSAGITWLASNTVDPFSAQDAAPWFGARLGAFPLAQGRWAFGVLASAHYGSQSGRARDSATSLEFAELGLGPEARYHFLPWLYAFARITPAAAYAQGSLSSAGSASLSGDGWAFALSGRGGAAARIWGPADGSIRAARGWFFLEAGYRYVFDNAFALTPPDDSPLNAEPFALAPLSLGGPELSVGLALTY